MVYFLRKHTFAVESLANCTHLNATSDDVDNFTSHDSFIRDINYRNNYERCWLIATPPGESVKAWGNEPVALEQVARTTGECYDFVDVTCNISTRDSE